MSISGRPDGWKLTSLESLTSDITYGYTAKSNSDTGDAKMLRITDIQDNNVDWDTVPYCAISKTDKARYSLKQWDLVFARTGATVGKSFLIREDHDDAVFASYLIRVRCLEGRFAAYLSHFFNSADYWNQITDFSAGIGQPNVNGSKLKDLVIPLAPFAEQTRIVAKLEELLSDLDAGVAELKAAQAKLGQYRQSLLKAAVDGSLTVEWRKKHKPKESGGQLLERILAERRKRWEEKQFAKFCQQGKSPPNGWENAYSHPVKPDTKGLPELPEGWVWASLDMLGEIVSGVAKGTKRGAGIVVREVPYLRVANVQRGFLDLSEVKTIPATEGDVAELALQPGDILFNEGGDRDKLGRGWVWRGEVSECIHQNHVFRVRPWLAEVMPEFISHHGNTFGKLWFQSAGKQTTNLASINMSILRGFPLPVPPVDEQLELLKAIEEHVEPLGRQGLIVQAGLAQAEAQRRNILKAAFSGQLVPQDPNDEPASVLLERIRVERIASVTKGAKRGRKAKQESV